jgi:hypothetical protein
MASRSKSSARVEIRREVSAGGLIWRRNPAGGIEVVLVKPAGKDYWALPKGHLEQGETDVSYVYSFHEDATAPLVRVFKKVHFFLMRLKGGDTSNHDSEIDQVAWLDLGEAIRQASFKSESKLISKAATMLPA